MRDHPSKGRAPEYVTPDSLGFRRSRHWRDVADALGLSPREAELIECLLDLCDDDEIASRLHISRHTVHSFFQRLFRKLRVSNRCQVLARVLLACFESHVRTEAATSRREVKTRGGQNVAWSAIMFAA